MCWILYLWKATETSVGKDLQLRRICTEEKGKVIAASWGTELLQFVAALAILQQDNLKNRLICTRTS